MRGKGGGDGRGLCRTLGGCDAWQSGGRQRERIREQPSRLFPCCALARRARRKPKRRAGLPRKARALRAR